jgi:hypothetical protein
MVAVGDNDAKSCFNRHLIMLAILIFRSTGLSKATRTMILTTLTWAEYYVKTNNGISENFYKWLDNRRVHGPGQGYTIKPSMFLAIFSILFWILSKEPTQVHFQIPSGHQYRPHNINGYVNNITLKGTTTLDKTITPTISDLFTTWARILNISGGLLEIQKCSYYVLQWNFDMHGNAILNTNNNHLTSVEIATKTRTTKSVPQIITNQAVKSLGFWISPDVTTTTQGLQLTTKKSALITKHGQIHLERIEVSIEVNTLWMPEIGYPIAICLLEAKPLQQIQTKRKQFFAPRMGWSSTTPNSVLYGSKHLGGTEFPHLHDAQIGNQVGLFIKTFR